MRRGAPTFSVCLPRGLFKNFVLPLSTANTRAALMSRATILPETQQTKNG